MNPDPEIAAKEVCDNWKSSSARNSDGLTYIEENRIRLEAEGADVPDRLRELLLQYSSQFKSFPDTLPELDPELLQRIHLTDGPPPASRPYRLSPSQLAACKEQLDKLLSAGLIRNAACYESRRNLAEAFCSMQ